jgi:hypothetical protein
VTGDLVDLKEFVPTVIGPNRELKETSGKKEV